ncbi:MAG TPA: c-type cytochrome biogenesis protein CcmI [Alphaproteobacteria bacterium]|jgi:cytochrome c-type biogenesis protein CcmH|nr:c-type cytochrome biogenesis protein CcmI [Alphaproteobacteria bacterium]
MIGFWIGAAFLTAAVVALLGRPLMRKSPTGLAEEGTDLAVYRDQLAELEREKARGLIEADQAASLETEIGRRMLIAARTVKPVATTTAPSRALTAAIALLFPILGLLIYFAVGRPDLPGMPLAEREISPGSDPAKVLAAIEQVKSKLKRDPSDLDRWAAIGEAYEKLGRPRDAVETFRIAVGIAPEDSTLKAALAEALIAANGGAVGEEAKQIFSAIPPDADARPEARFYLALAAAQAGDNKAALQQWQALLADSPADASWVDATRERIAAAAKSLGLDPAKETPDPRPPAPPSNDPAGIARMTPEQQSEMIRGMVAKLAAKMEANPDDANGWRQLARAYEVIGDKDKAKNALDRAATAEAKAAKP